MTIRRKGAAPWSIDYDSGLADAPVNSHPGVEADQVIPVIDAGYIGSDGNWQIDQVSNDRDFTFQDPNQALGAGASMYIDPIDMLNHDLLIVGILDSSGNDIGVDLVWLSNPSINTGPYAAGPFIDSGLFGDTWRSNDPGDGSAALVPILNDTGEGLATSWRFFKVAHLRGTVGNFQIRSNEGVNAGTISTAYLRIV